jgi:hypothetical protein
MAKELVGRALYIELRRGTETSQVILTPQLSFISGDSDVKPCIISRQLTAVTKRKGWRYSSGPRISSMDTTEDIQRATEIVYPMIKWVTPFLSGYQAGGWEVFTPPLVIEMSSEDVELILSKKTPAALIRRIMKAREVAGLPAEVTVPLPYVPVSVPF